MTNPGFKANGATTTPTGWTTYSANGTGTASYTGGDHPGTAATATSSPTGRPPPTAWTPTSTCSGLTNGDYTLGVWVRSGGGENSDYIALTNCGGSDKTTYVPVVRTATGCTS